MLDAKRVSDIAVLFLDGDSLEQVLIDKMGHTDYHFDHFNRLKRTLIQVEKIEPSLRASAILWQAYATNNRVGAPLVVGSSLPLEGCKRQTLPPEVRTVLLTETICEKRRENGTVSLYRPVRNSCDEVVGVLELLCGLEEKRDVSFWDMFETVRQTPQEEDEE